MARARLALCSTLLVLLMSFQIISASVDPPTEPPSSEADAPEFPTPNQAPLSPSPDISSPPAPPPDSSSSAGPSPSLPPSDDDEDEDEDEGPSPSPSPADGQEADAPAPEADEWTNVKSDVKPEKKELSEAMSGGKKAGIVIGVFAFAGLAALGGFVYKKRKENMERAAFGAAVRRELL